MLETFTRCKDSTKKSDNGYISTYAALTRLSISTAQRELRRWQDAPNNHIGYTLIAGRRHTIWQP